MASLVVGADLPPLRLHIIKSILQPASSEVLGCIDQDCMFTNCQGNRVKLEDEDDTCVGVVFHVVHHKNDRRERHQQPVSFNVPKGDLLDLMVVHIKRGRPTLNCTFSCMLQGELSPYLFVSNIGNSFSDSTFVHYWDTLMANSRDFGFQRFPPTYGRTIFVEAYTEAGDPALMEGASIVMGNSLKQWRAHYNPSRRRRMVESSVSGHAEFTAASNNKRAHM